MAFLSTHVIANSATSPRPKVRHYTFNNRSSLKSNLSEFQDAQIIRRIDSIAANRVREPHEIIATLDSTIAPPLSYNIFMSPLTFTGFVPPYSQRTLKKFVYSAPQLSADSVSSYTNIITERKNSLIAPIGNLGAQTLSKNNTPEVERLDYLRRVAWLKQQYMLKNPEKIEFALWLLPLPPEMPEEDYSFEGYMKRLRIPASAFGQKEMTLKPKYNIRRYYWLHNLTGGVQFSQAYISPNWYQGGNDHLALLINFYWNVKLNQVYNPNLLFENTISYKLGLNSTQEDEYHNYSVSEDLFQWNLNFGFKAKHNWYYSLTTQFKTQLLNTYPQNSQTRTASFLSPGDLNVGIGMTYSKENAKKTCKFKAALSPLSYNLKTCIDEQVDHAQFNIKEGRNIHNEIGSSAELTLDWNLTSNINYRSRMFIFSDYKNYTHDWENTFSFSINRFLSTQIYAHLRYDTSASAASGWKHWMLKEILSFGFSYAFSTK